MIVARHERRNRKITATTISVASSERLQHLRQRAADEGRLVGGDADVDARRQRRVELGDRRAHAVGDVERVRLRLPDDAEADAGLAVDADASSSPRPGRRSRRRRRRRWSTC